MAYYKFLARTREGKPEEGFQEAHNEDELIGILQSQGLTIVTFKEVRKEDLKAGPKKKRKMSPGVKLDDLIIFSRQLSTLLNAGITLIRSLEIASMQISSKPLYQALEEIKKDVSAGSSLKAAVARHPKIFSKLWVNIVETGETTGQLSFALEQISVYLESAAELQRKIVNALVYPCVILTVAVGAILVFILKIMPGFESMYKEFGAKLPGFTLMVFTICGAIRKYILFIIAALVGVGFVLRSYGKTHKGRERIDGIKLKIFVFGDLLKQVAAVRFASGLSMLIKSGTPILHALDIVTEISGNIIIMNMLQRVKENVREGKSMAEPLLEGGLFPDMVAHMVAVGEESGELATMLENIAKFYNERVDASITRLTTLFEPFLIVSIGLIVGTMIIAMFLPIFGLAGAIKG